VTATGIAVVRMPAKDTKVCECAKEISLHVHAVNGEHWCDWCGGIVLKNGKQLKAVHKKGICACPSMCPRGAHISRRCRQ
jgi:hypothetical protein